MRLFGVGGVLLWSLSRRLSNAALLRNVLTSLLTDLAQYRRLARSVEREVGVLMGKSVVAMRSPFSKRSWMVSACSMILCLVWILCERVVDLFMGCECCKSETSLPSSCWSSAVVSADASRISNDN